VTIIQEDVRFRSRLEKDTSVDVNTEASGRAEHRRLSAVHGKLVQGIAGVKHAASKVVEIVEVMINKETLMYILQLLKWFCKVGNLVLVK
jgi:hypothetical protein